MKKSVDVQIKRNTTNYAPDSHKKFCERCYKHNGVCPMTGNKSRSTKCNV